MRKSHARQAVTAPGVGVYVLVLRLEEPGIAVRVGALGRVRFEPSYYAYVGSARRALAARLTRHLRRSGKRRHWHVDYLRARTEPVAALAWAGDGVSECALSNAVARLAPGSVPRFGSSDCRCRSHLHHFPADPTEVLLDVQPHPGVRAQLVWRATGRRT